MEQLPVDSLIGTRDLSLHVPTSQPPRPGTSTLAGLFSGRPSSSLPRTILENPDEETLAEQRASAEASGSLFGEATAESAEVAAPGPPRRPLSELQVSGTPSPVHSLFSNASTAPPSPHRGSPKLLPSHALPNGSGAVSTAWLSAHSRRPPSTPATSPALSMTSEDTFTAPTRGAATSPHVPIFRTTSLNSASGTDTAPFPAGSPWSGSAGHFDHNASAHASRHIYLPPGVSPRSHGTGATASPRRPPHATSADALHSLGMSSATSPYSSGSLPSYALAPQVGGSTAPSADLPPPAPQRPLPSDASTTHEEGTIDSLSWEAGARPGPMFAPMSAPASIASSTGAGAAGPSWPHVNSDALAAESAALAASPPATSGEATSSTVSVGNPESAERLMASLESAGSAAEAAARRLPAPLDPDSAAAAAATAAAASGAALDVFWDSQASWGYVYRSRDGTAPSSSRHLRDSSSTSTPGRGRDVMDSGTQQTVSSAYRTGAMPLSEGQASASTAAAPSFVDFLLEDPIQSDVAAALDADSGPPFSAPSAAVAALSPAAVVAAATGASATTRAAPRSTTAPDLHPQLSMRQRSMSSQTGDLWDAAHLLSDEAHGLNDPSLASAMSSVATNALFVSPRPLSNSGSFLLESTSGDLTPAVALAASGQPSAPGSADLDHPDDRSSSGAGRRREVSAGSAPRSFCSAASRDPGGGGSSAPPEHSAGELSQATSTTLSFFTAPSTAPSTSAQTLSGTVTLGSVPPPSVPPGNEGAALDTRDSLSSSSFISAASTLPTAAPGPSNPSLPATLPTPAGVGSTRGASARTLRQNPGNPPVLISRAVPVPLPLLLELADSDDTCASRTVSVARPGGLGESERLLGGTAATSTSHSEGVELTADSSVSEGAASRSSFGDPILAAPPAVLLFRPPADG